VVGHRSRIIATELSTCLTYFRIQSFTDNDKTRACLKHRIWAKVAGGRIAHLNRSTLINGKLHAPGVYPRLDYREQFKVAVGTI
jgi:hypothetical protein